MPYWSIHFLQQHSLLNVLNRFCQTERFLIFSWFCCSSLYTVCLTSTPKPNKTTEWAFWSPPIVTTVKTSVELRFNLGSLVSWTDQQYLLRWTGRWWDAEFRNFWLVNCLLHLLDFDCFAHIGTYIYLLFLTLRNKPEEWHWAVVLVQQPPATKSKLLQPPSPLSWRFCLQWSEERYDDGLCCYYYWCDGGWWWWQEEEATKQSRGHCTDALCWGNKCKAVTFGHMLMWTTWRSVCESFKETLASAVHGA